MISTCPEFGEDKTVGSEFKITPSSSKTRWLNLILPTGVRSRFDDLKPAQHN